MVEKQTWFFISYASAFLSVYLMSLAYPLIATSFQVAVPMNTFTMSYNATMTGLVGVQNIGSWFPLISVVIVMTAIVGLITASFAFGRGMG